MGIILKPFAWLLLFFYNYFGYAVALMLFALVVKLILFPLSLKGKKSMIKMNLLSGKMQQLQKQYGKDRERYQMEVQKLYEREKVNPMGGCLWSLLPLFVLIPLYYIIREPLTYFMDLSADQVKTVAEITGVAMKGAYPQIAMANALSSPEVLAQVQAALGEAGSKVFAMNFQFLGINLAAIPNWQFWQGGISWSSVGLFLLPLVSVGVSLLSMQVSLKTNQMNRNQVQDETTAKTNRTMMIMMPLMSLWIGFTVPAGLSIYWIAQYFFSIFQELICGKLLKKDYEAAQAAAAQRELEEKEEEKRRKEEARLERQRRLEEEKKNRGKKKAVKKDEDAGPAINKEDSRIGIRAYARGRAYDPNRFGGVTPYVDPSDLIAAQKAAEDEKIRSKNKKNKKKEQPEDKQEVQQDVQTVQQPAPEIPAPEQEQPENEAAPETAEDTQAAETVEEVQEQPQDEDDKKEGV